MVTMTHPNFKSCGIAALIEGQYSNVFYVTSTAGQELAPQAPYLTAA